MSDFFDRISNPGQCFDPIKRLRERQDALLNYAERQEQRKNILFDPVEAAREREYLMANPGVEDINNVLGKSRKM